MGNLKVGILSMQRVINYGSFLQAYALKQLLIRNGAGKVFFIDIIPGRILVENGTAKKNKWMRYAETLLSIKSISQLISRAKTFLFQKRVAKSIQKAWPILDGTSKPVLPLDLIVIGSDEVFNCCQDVRWGFSTQLFGDISGSYANRVVSYAASFGYTDIEMINYYGIRSEIAVNLKKLFSISVRDENSAAIIHDLVKQTPLIHIDPVLAYGYEEEIAEFQQKPMAIPYMIIYSYQGRIKERAEIEALCNYSKINKLKLVSIFSRYDWCDESIIPSSPFEVLRWFKFADCIVTDTFHGTIFSIITKSIFATILRPSNKNKLGHLLEIFGLQERVFDANDLSSILHISPNFDYCEAQLSKYRKETENYLKYVLKS